MTHFTDMELNRLKWVLDNPSPGWVDKDNLSGLIARLEMAESRLRIVSSECKTPGFHCLRCIAIGK